MIQKHCLTLALITKQSQDYYDKVCRKICRFKVGKSLKA